MAKSIKFNLLCDNVPVRTIEDLQNEFVIEDVLEYFKKGLLAKWLEVRGYDDYLAKVSAITTTDDVQIIKSLIKIFELELEDSKIEESVYHMNFVNERVAQLKKDHELEVSFDQQLNTYFEGYRKLITDLESSGYNVTAIKSTLKALMERYPQFIQMEGRSLFYKFIESNKLVILCMLMYDNFRQMYLPQPIGQNNNDGAKEYKYDIYYNKDKYEIYSRIVQEIDSFIKLPSVLCCEGAAVYNGAAWYDIAPNGKFMIIKMEPGCYVHSADSRDTNISYEQAKEQFLILDGLRYLPNKNGDVLYYIGI